MSVLQIDTDGYAGPPEELPDCPEPFEPDQGDIDHLLDLEEREEIERAWGCNARFSPDCRWMSPLPKDHDNELVSDCPAV